MTVRKLVTRREFVRQAAAIGSATVMAPTIISSTAFGKPGAPGPNDRVTIGFIGCGRQTNEYNIPLFVNTPGVQVLAVCDVDSWRLGKSVELIKQQYSSGSIKGSSSDVASYVDYQDLLARQDIDAVCIGTPDHWHVKMTLDALQAGKDVALEKPITRTIRDGQRLIEAVQKQGRVFRVDSEFRSLVPCHRATSLVRNGYLGQVRRVEVGVPVMDSYCPPQPTMDVPEELDYKRWLGEAPPAPYTEKRVHPRKSFDRPGWFSIMDYADGVITNWGAHLNDGAMWAVDKERVGPTEISGRGKYLPADSFYNVLAEFDLNYRFADGLEWRYRTDAPYIRIEGDEGWVWADFEEFRAEPKSLLTVELKSSDQVFPLKSEKQDFIECVRSRKEPIEPIEVGHRVTSLGLLGNICIYLGESLRWDPRQERFLNNDKANELLDKPICKPPSV